jgi:RNA polymerase sigma-70 factor (ECF subfamily)
MAEAPAAVRDPLHEVYVAHYQRLVGLARLLVRDGHDAEEVVQEAFARTWARGAGRVDDPVAYVQRAVVNLCRSRLRRARTASHHVPEAPAPAEAAEAGALRASDGEAVVAAVRRLPRRQRECVVLRYYADLTVPQIALRLGLADGSVKSHLHRATTALATELEAHR